MSELSVDEYISILNGGNRGNQFSSNYYVVSREEKKKTTQKQILLKEGVGLPTNLNDEYDEKQPRKKKRKVDPEILRRLTRL